MSRTVTVIVAALVLTLGPVPRALAKAEPRSPEERAAALVAQMTLDEKLTQTHTTGRGAGGIARFVPGIARLGIPDFLITNGPAGVGTGAVPEQPNATALPAPVALAAGFDPDLARVDNAGAVSSRRRTSTWSASTRAGGRSRTTARTRTSLGPTSWASRARACWPR
ncbi:MAG TPA: hypothetical protein VGR06_26610 [Actinophytocola sp.]|jgi:beta-glucosidase-like glycosyl hydrolase|uniref:hypothetical protein n=1 Tax=Actinophytocola sp. TaxID=1872138 RepID=UPI002E05CF84|nr:hypothetical protein [Actinophytocola sp.]